MKYNYNFFKRHSYLSIVLLYVLLFIPIICTRFQDLRNEIKYLVVTDQFISDKNLFILKYLNKLYPDKPPFYFWILGLSKIISKTYFPIIAIILGSLIPSFIIAIIFYKFITRLKDKDMAFCSTFSLILLPLFTGLGAFLRMDMLMTMFITISLYLFFGFYYKWFPINTKYLFLFYISIFLGLFTKGIAGFALPILIPIVFLIFEKKISFLKTIKLHIGLIFIILLISIWFSLIYISPEGKEYIMLMIGQETVGRIVKSKAHIKPFYYYITELPPIVFPYTIAIIWASILKFKTLNKWKNWAPMEKIGFIWTFVPLIMFSLASGKLAVYLLPLMPGVIMLIHSTFIKKDIKYKEIILKTCEILPIIPFVISIIEKKKRDIYSRINRINYSLIIIFFIAFTGINYYNTNYTVKPFLKILREHKVYMYTFNDGLNLKYFVPYNITTFNSIEKVNVASPKYVMTKFKYHKILEDNNYKIMLKNKNYAIFIKDNKKAAN